MVFFGRRYVVRSNDPAINQCINASILTMAIYLVSMVTSGIYRDGISGTIIGADVANFKNSR